MIKMLFDQLAALIVFAAIFMTFAFVIGGLVNLCLDKSASFRSFTNKLMGTEIFDDAE